MGRPYARELSELESTYDHVAKLDISEFARRLESILHRPLAGIGSGGSYSAASYLCLLHSLASGRLSKSMTPLEAAVTMPVSHDTAVAFVSASGRNKDILAACRQAIDAESAGVLATTVQSQSKLATLVRGYARGSAFEIGSGISRDGYLATNSLLAFSALFLRSYAEAAGSSVHIPNNLSQICSAIRLSDLSERPELTIATEFGKPRTLCLVHCPLSIPAAVDLESRLTESALLNVQIADLRNFGHGRHHWLARHPAETVVLFLTSDRFADLASRSARQLPAAVRSFTVQLGLDPWVVGLGGLVFSMRLVGAIASVVGIDPGRPHIPSFGRKLYRLGHSKWPTFIRQPPAPILRKSLAIAGHFPTERDEARISTEMESFVSALEQARFTAMVVDFDGTMVDTNERYGPVPPSVIRPMIHLLRHGIRLGIVSGRGGSLLDVLKPAIPRDLRHRVLLGLHHGAIINSLDAAPRNLDDIVEANDAGLGAWRPVLGAVSHLYHGGIKVQKDQIRLAPARRQSVDALWRQVAAEIATANMAGVRVLKSGHSVDVIRQDVSKLKIIEALAECDSSLTTERVLAIGDAGFWPGNDHELLSLPYSLSVDEVDGSGRRCWNLAPPGVTNRRAFEFYLSRLFCAEAGSFAFVGLARGGSDDVQDDPSTGS